MENDKEKKRSFEEILSDLNSLLEKMPEIVSSKMNKDQESNGNIENIKKDDIQLQQHSNEEIVDSADTKNNSIIENQQNKEKVYASSELDVKKDTINLDEVQVFNPNILLNETPQENKNDVQIDDTEDKEIKNHEEIGKNISVKGVDEEKETKDKEIKDNVVEQKDDLNVNIELDVKDIDVSLDEDATEIKGENQPVEKTENEFGNIEINIEETSQEEVKKEDSNVNIRFSIDLNSIIAKDPPSNIPEERIKKVGFVLAGEEGDLKKLLEIIDEICLSSETKPMFVKRSFVINYDVDFNTDSLILNAKENKVDAVIVVGEPPMDKLYEIENVISSNNILFTNFKKENISNHYVIDFIMELIVR